MVSIRKVGIYSPEGKITMGSEQPKNFLLRLLPTLSISLDFFRNSEEKPIDVHVSSRTEGEVHVCWLFKGNIYEVEGVELYTKDQIRLLVFDEFDKERRLFERLAHRYETGDEEATQKRVAIPEAVRIEVWRRDGGKCVNCGSRENLEYDHIIPVSKGGSNTARNIELLCETCNRSKGARIG